MDAGGLLSPTSNGNGDSSGQLPSLGPFYGGPRSYNGGGAPPPAPLEHHLTAPGIAGAAKQGVYSPQQGGLRTAMTGSSMAPPSPSQYAPICSPASMPLPTTSERRNSGGLIWANSNSLSNNRLSALDSGLIVTESAMGNMGPASLGGGYQTSAPAQMPQQPMPAQSMLASRGGTFPQSTQAMPVSQTGPHGAHPSSVFMMGMPQGPNSNGAGDSAVGGLASPLQSPSGGGGTGVDYQRQCSSDLFFVRPSDSSMLSQEHGPSNGIGGNMDLEAALEAILSFESADGGAGANAVSAAQAAAAHNSLQQHVAAAIQAAAVRASGRGSASADGGVGSLGMNLAAVARLSADGGGVGGLGHMGSNNIVGSAPSSSMAAFLQRQADAQASCNAVSAPFNRLTLDPSTGMLMNEEQSAAADAAAATAAGMAAAARCAAGNQVSNGGFNSMSPVSQSAPRSSAGWGSVNASRLPNNANLAAQPTQSMGIGGGTPVKQQLDRSVAMMLGSPTSPAMSAAAARSAMAAALQQQQQQQAAALGLMGNRGLSSLVAAANQQQVQQQLLNGLPTIHASSGMLNTRLWPRLSPIMRAEVQQLLAHLPGVKAEELDDGVLYQLVTAKRSEDDAQAALRTLRALAAHDLSTSLQHLSAYMPLGVDSGGSSPFSPVGYVNRTVSGPLPSSSRAVLQKLPSRVLTRLEEVVSRCSYIDWKHFDAGVLKVICQLSELSETDVLEELQLLEATDLSNVEYMPAYLNKRLNNRLWSRRKAQQQLAQVLH